MREVGGGVEEEGRVGERRGLLSGPRKLVGNPVGGGDGSGNGGHGGPLLLLAIRKVANFWLNS